jgi:PAT family beta-lactamase induction signal transducer AmpG
VYLAGRTSWLLGFGTAGVLMLAVAAFNALFIPNPSEPRALRSPGGSPAWLTAYKTFFAQPAAARVLAFIFFHKLGDIMMFAMSKPLLRDIGMDTATRGVIGGVGLVVFIASTIAGGTVIARLGLERCLVPMTYVQNFAIPLYLLLALARPPLPAVMAIVALEQCASGIGESAKAVFLLQRCRTAFSASHFAFATAVVALGSTVAGAFSGHLAKLVGLSTYFAICFVVSWPSLALVLLVPRAPIDPDPSVAPEPTRV